MGAASDAPRSEPCKGPPYADRVTIEPPVRPEPAPGDPRTQIVWASIALALAVLCWIINPLFLPSVLAILFAIRVLLKARRMFSSSRRIARGLAIAAIVIAAVGLAGSLLFFVYR